MITNDASIIPINLGERNYRIIIGEGLLHRLGELIEFYLNEVTSIVVVTQSSIDNLYGDVIIDALSKYTVNKIIVPEGEEAKTWAQTGHLIGSILKIGLDRRGLIIAFGGGTVGDLAGFVASIYLRGIRFIQVPTTILGMLDSSIGGKTAVNHDFGKNLIGSFYQPSLVVSDPILLKSLPRREVVSGIAEAVKYGVVADESLLTIIESNRCKLLNIDTYELKRIISICTSIKSKYVEADEFDNKGERYALNYGHTFGHALESITEHEINHGEAISIGMIIASRIALTQKLIEKSDYDRQLSLLTGLGLPTKLPPIDQSGLIRYMRRDKKSIAGKIRLVLPTGIGCKPVLQDVTENNILNALEE